MQQSVEVEPQLVALHDCSSEQFDEACNILSDQWPRPRAARMRWLQESSADLPTSFALIIVDHGSAVVVGHARLSHSRKVGGAMDHVSAIVTSVVVDKRHRRKGYGRLLLRLVEDACRSIGFGRVVLWTDDQVPFYESCGYVKCRPLQVVSAAASNIEPDQLKSLEAMLFSRSQTVKDSCRKDKQNQGSTSELAVDETGDVDVDANSVWLSKRLVEHFERTWMDRGQVEDDVRNQLLRQGKQPSQTLCLLCDIPNETQIGPCCGLAAMRCVLQYLSGESAKPHVSLEDIVPNEDWSDTILYSSSTDKEQMVSDITLLEYAKEMKWTTDGEMFNAVNLAKLGTNPGGLETMAVRNMTASMLFKLITHNVPLVVAFDKSPKDLENAVSLDSDGSRAHWGVIRGVAVVPCPERESGITWLENTQTNEAKIPADLKIDNEKLFVVLQHTKHDRVCVVPFTTILESNKNLDNCKTSDDLGVGWVETDRMLASIWLICAGTMKTKEH